MQCDRQNIWEYRNAASPVGGAAAAYRGGLVRFIVAIDNYEHVALAYGSGAAAAASGRVRDAIREWLGDRIELHFESAGIFYGTLHPDSTEAGPDGAGEPDRSHAIANRLLVNPPVVFLPHEGATICLALSGTWAVHDGLEPASTRPFEGGCRPVFFGQAPGRGPSWVERYRQDMAIAASVLGPVASHAVADRRAAAPVRSTAGAVFQLAHPLGLDRRPSPLEFGRNMRARRSGDDPLIFSWRPVRDGQFGQDILFYEMNPQLIGHDGVRRDLADCRPVLERLGFSAALDQFLVHSALDLLEADPDVALAVQVSAQSVSACPRWGGLFRRLTGSRSVAGRLTIAITETANFPDFAEAIQFVSRLQAFGCLVGIDNFGLGYTSIRELLALAPDIVCIDPFFVRHGSANAPEGAVLGHLAGLGGLLASTVVVKGVSNERQSRLALEAGIRWQQGDYLGGAAAGRPWASAVGHGPCSLQHRAERDPRAA